MYRTLLCAALLASAASADVVHLRSGGRLEGATSVEGDRLVVRLESGTVKIPLDQVRRVVPATSPADEYATRAAAVAKDDVKAHWELALWCEERGLTRGTRVELEAVIAADPEHAEARKRLGYQKVGNEWLRGEALLTAQGMVKFEGKWLTKEEAAALAAEKERREVARLEAELRALEARQARAEARARSEAYARAGVGDYEPTRRNRDPRRGYGYGSVRDYGYVYRPRHRPGYVVGIGGPIYDFGYIPWGYGYGYGSYGYRYGYRPVLFDEPGGDGSGAGERLPYGERVYGR